MLACLFTLRTALYLYFDVMSSVVGDVSGDSGNDRDGAGIPGRSRRREKAPFTVDVAVFIAEEEGTMLI